MKPINAKCSQTWWNRAQQAHSHFFDILCVSFLSGLLLRFPLFQFWVLRLVSFLHSSAAFIYMQNYHVSVVSQSRFWCPVPSFICQIPSRLAFISRFPFLKSRIKNSGPHLAEYKKKKTACITLTPPSVRHTASCVLRIPAGPPSSTDSLQLYRQASLFQRQASSWSVLLRIENSEQRSLAGTQQCVQTLTSVHVTFGVYWEYRECIL